MDDIPDNIKSKLHGYFCIKKNSTWIFYTCTPLSVALESCLTYVGESIFHNHINIPFDNYLKDLNKYKDSYVLTISSDYTFRCGLGRFLIKYLSDYSDSVERSNNYICIYLRIENMDNAYRMITFEVSEKFDAILSKAVLLEG